MLTLASLVAAGAHPTQARQFIEPLQAACALFAIDTPARLGSFLGQVLHESSSLTRLEESLYYTTPERIRDMWPRRVHALDEAARLCRNPQALANRVYANRGGNGDEASGDGWRFRGRGLFQLTFKNNYADAAGALVRPYVGQPDLVAQPGDAALTAAWYWNAHGLNALADAWNLDDITRAINGPGMVGAAERRHLSDRAVQALKG